jgi:hypothetical protein
MTADVLFPILLIAMMLVLVGRRFWSRSVRPRETVRLTLIWLAIVGGLWLIVTLIRTG